jgi:hypothetical protein
VISVYFYTYAAVSTVPLSEPTAALLEDFPYSVIIPGPSCSSDTLNIGRASSLFTVTTLRPHYTLLTIDSGVMCLNKG